MKIIITVFYVLVCLLLIAAVILQSGRSAGLSGSIGGASESIFGKKKGLDDWLAKVTVWVAVVFGATSLLLVVWK
ncbi:MAG: preprotein translocase subunit SecG [Bacillota bacterium]